MNSDKIVSLKTAVGVIPQIVIPNKNPASDSQVLPNDVEYLWHTDTSAVAKEIYDIAAKLSKK